MKSHAVLVAGLVLAVARLGMADSRDVSDHFRMKGFGTFSGTVSYDPGAAGDDQGTLIIHLVNVLSDASFSKGFITTVAFDAKGDVSGPFEDADDASTDGVDESKFRDIPPAAAKAFTDTDGGKGLGCVYIGGNEPPDDGIGMGHAANLKFNLTGPDADTLTADDVEVFVRFRGLDKKDTEEDDLLSDKATSNANPTLVGVSPGPVVIPLPPAAWSGLAMLVGAIALSGLRMKLRHIL
jgi:hypothetical protein